MFQSYDAPKPKKVPTLSQYLKKTKEPKSKPFNSVELVWLPDQFDNVTLQTQNYRIVLGDNHPLYKATIEYFQSEGTLDTNIRAQVTDWAKGTFEISPGSEKGNWAKAGNNGYRWKPDK